MKGPVSMIVCVMVCALSSCSPKVTSNLIYKYPKQEPLENVMVIKEKEPLPSDAEWMGTIDVKGKASHDRMLELTRFRAWESGADYLRERSFGSDGVRSDIRVMTSDIYHADKSKVAPDDNRRVENAAGYSQTATPAAVPTAMEQFGSQHFKVFVGYGRRLNRISPELTLFQREHIRRLLNGVMMGGQYIYFFNPERGSGVGLRYQIMHSSSADAGYRENNGGEEGVLDESVNISFIGPLYSGRWVSKNGKHLLLDDVGFGLMRWKDYATFLDEKQIMIGNTLGFLFDISYSYVVSDKLALGADLSYTSGMIKSMVVSDGTHSEVYRLDKEHYEGLVHLGICAQLVYTF